MQSGLRDTFTNMILSFSYSLVIFCFNPQIHEAEDRKNTLDENR